MTRINVNVPDRAVAVDGVGLIVRDEFWPTDGPPGAYAIQWDGTTGHVEQEQVAGREWVPHSLLTDESALQPYIDAYASEKAAAEREFLAKQAKVNAIELGAKVSTSIDEPATTLEGQA